MITHFQHQRPTLAYRILSMLIVVAFTFSVIAPPTPVYAQMFPQGLANMPLPGTMITMSPGFTPAMVTGVTIHPENPLEFDFIIGSGDDRLEGEAFEQESTKLIKYFLAALTVPEKEMWVNLSPYEEDRIIPAQFGNTEMGRDLLAQDYILKQLTASLMYPENELGERFWRRVRAKAYERFGTTEIPMNTFNKIWIIPDEAIVYEQGESAFVVKSHLKVMLEEDYVALNKNLDVEKYGLDSLVENEAQIISGISSQVVREVLIPEIEKEVNGGETFANLRQIYNSVILATWYKQNLKDSLLGQVYVGKNKTAGVMVDDKQAKEKIYAQYLEAFEKGVYNYIKEDYDPVTEQVTPRKYFSGGTTFEAVGQLMTKFNTSSSPLKQAEQRTVTTFFAQAPAYRGNNIVTVGLVEVATGSDAASVTAFAQPIAASSPVKAVLPRVNPTKTKSWAKLKELLARAKERYDLRTLFDADRSRAEKFSLELNDGFKVDFSKNLIDEETLAVLLELADEVSLGQAIEQMFSGEKINETEGRAVLHTALRNVTRDESGKIVAANGPVYVDGQDVMPKVIEVLNKVQAFSEKVRSGEWKGATGKRIKHIVNVGIGGSDLGPRMAARALTPFGRDSGIQVHFISNVDGTAAAELIRELGLNPEETLIVIESKTFTTQETIRNALTLKNWVSEFYADVAGVSDAEAISKHFVAVSTAEELVDAFGIDTENMFEFWDWVGGRYSLWSAIGLTLSAYVGFDNYFEMLEGAREADEHFRNQPFKQNIPVLQALISVWYRNFLNAETHAVVAYDEYLALFSSYLAQAQMESNGKGTDRDGNFITDYQTGPVLWGGAGTDMQHATMQQWHQGTSIIPAEIVSVRKSQNPIEEGDHHRKLYANSVAQPYALAFGFKLEEVKKALSDGEMSDQELQWLAAHRTFPGNKPTTSVLLEEMDPRTLGSLIALYEHKIMAEGIIYNIFSFDQWGVQLGKVIASRDVLPFLDGSRPLSELEDVPYGASIRDAIVTFNAKNAVTSSPAQAKEKLDPKLVAAQTVMTRHNLHNSKTLKALLRSLNGESFQQVRKDLERGLRGEKSKARLNTKSLVNEAARTLTQVQAASASSPVKVGTEERSKTEPAEEISIEKAKQIFLDLIPGADEEAAPIADIRKTADLESKLATAALEALRDAGEIDIASEPGKVKIMRKLQVNTESNEKIQTKIVTILAEQLGKTEAEVEIHLDTDFAEAFWSTDSLDVVELIMEIEDEFDMSVPDEEAEKIRTPRNMIDYVQNVASSPVGGINLNPELIDLQIRRDGNGVPLPVNLQPVHQMKIDGFVPVIINVTPILNLPLLLGFSDTGSPLDSAQADLQAETYKLSLIDKCRNKYIYQHEHQNDDIDA